MELREFATHILSADTLKEKLFTPDVLTDDHPGPVVLWKEPSRPLNLRLQKYSRKDRLPSLADHKDPDKRAICLHRFAGHELLAVEIMAYALLAFPEAPTAFRRGVAYTLCEEQEHVRLYMQQMQRLGIAFGDLPLYRHFWAYVPYLTTPLHYLSVMSLTFEMANLDFAPLYGASFAKYGDTESAALMERILRDEIGHVALGRRFLEEWKKPEASDWETWKAHLPPRMVPSRAKGWEFFEENRKRAGISSEWIEKLKNS
ncbi:MAG: DUF455 family protein [Verrucomicrobia bacterium]|nr:DUF455 family protein [Verrucomicrobiota bacterium]